MQYAIITGGTQGLGKAITEKLLTEGFSVAICARNRDELQEIEKNWQSQYPTQKVICYPADMGAKEQVNAFADVVLEKFPAIDLLVNNAGIFLPGSVGDAEDGNLESLMAINLFSAYYMTRKVLPAMKKAGSGHIFNMCSVSSLKAYPNGASYGISKYALNGFSENLRDELKPFNIKVTALFPGATDTRTWDGSGFEPTRMMQSADVASMLWASYSLSALADVESIVMRPIKGDL